MDWKTKKKFLKMGGKTQKIPENGWLAPTAAKVKTVLTYPPLFPLRLPPKIFIRSVGVGLALLCSNFNSLWCWCCCCHQ